MILVTVGTHSLGFDRLVKAMDDLAATLHEEVVIQRGTSTYEPQYAKSFQLTTSAQMEQLTKDARVIVTHAAAGAVLVGLQMCKPLIVVPRRQSFGEHIDDHQCQLAVALYDTGKALAVYDVTADNLSQAIIKASFLSVNYTNVGSASLIATVRCQLNEWAIGRVRIGSLRSK